MQKKCNLTIEHDDNTPLTSHSSSTTSCDFCFNNPFLDKVYNIFYYVFRYMYTLGCLITKVVGIYMLWILLHYFGSHIYIRLCVPNSIYGFMISPFLTSTPHCQALRWGVYNGANIINYMWMEFGAWISSNIHIVK